MKYTVLMFCFIVIAGTWYTETQFVVYACSDAGNPPDVIKQCKSITRWQSWVKK